MKYFILYMALRHIALALALIFVGISANAAVQDYDVKPIYDMIRSHADNVTKVAIY